MTSERAARRGRLLAIDYGERRVGLALSDPEGIIASPAGFIVRRAGKRPPWPEIAKLVWDKIEQTPRG